MLFNSYQFILLYLPIVMMGFYLLVKMNCGRFARIFLLAASFFFYGFWDYRFLPLLLASILFNYWVGTKIIDFKSKGLLAFGVSVNLLLLFFFKYSHFF